MNLDGATSTRVICGAVLGLGEVDRLVMGAVAETVAVRLLGPVEVAVGDARVVLERRQERCLLAVLLLEHGRLVSVERLGELLWDGEPPQRYRSLLHTQISRVRAALRSVGAGDWLRTCGGGYLVAAPAGSVDVDRFRALVDEARACPQPMQRAGLWRAALELWRGPALADVGSDRLRQRLCAELDELRLVATEEWMASWMAAGHCADAVGELTRLTGEYPLRERLIELYLRALASSGRTAEALQAYEAYRARLADETGLDPGPGLAGTYLHVLRGELPAAGADAAEAAHPVEPSPVQADRVSVGAARRSRVTPAQLPADVSGFTGRGDHLRTLSALLDARDSASTAVMIIAITGTAGVGKTALAVHWGHRVRDRFPDGQLYANLRGFDPAGSAVGSAEVIRRFLDALEVPPARIPDDPTAQADLYRSVTADRRMLIVLDNARDADQVRPLLPGAPGCLVLVTSRNHLTGLAASDGARPFPLDVLSSVEARDLLAHRLGASRVHAEPEAVDEIIAECARLPLALTIAAARAQTTGFPLAALADEMRQANARLDALDAGDASTRVRAVFSWSYAALRPPAARLFRLLGTHPGPDISGAAAGSLADQSPSAAHRDLAQLATASLLVEHAPGRYAFHDLLRAYAADLARTVDSEQDRDAAMHRLLDYYQEVAATADAQMPRRGARRRRSPAPASTTTAPDLSTPALAAAWFRTERANLLACLQHLRDEHHQTRLVDLTISLIPLLRMESPWSYAIQWHSRALEASRELGDRQAEAWILSELAALYLTTDNNSAAEEVLEQAVILFQELGDRIGKAWALGEMGIPRRFAGDYPQAISLQEQALAIFRELGDSSGEAYTLAELGILHTATGGYPQAISLLQPALATFRELGNSHGTTWSLHQLGVLWRITGEYTQAATALRQALTAFRELGNRNGEASTLSDLGAVRRLAGDRSEAHDLLERALAAFRELGNRSGEAHVLAELGALRTTTGDRPEATHLLAEALAIFGDINEPVGEARVINQLGLLLLRSGEPEQAQEHHRRALKLAQEIRNPLEEGRALAGIGRCAIAMGEDGAPDLARALATLRRIGSAEAAELDAEFTGLRT